VPWGAFDKTAPSGDGGPVASRPSLSSPATASSGSARGTAAATGKTPAPPVDGQLATDARVTAGGSSPASSVPTSRPVTTAKPRETGRPAAPAAGVAPAEAGSLAAPPTVYWVQVGAFLDHKNADRLAERLRSDGLSAATTSFEQSRVLYRVLLVGSDGSRVTDDAVERVKGLGHPVEATADGPAVTGLVPLRRAVETSHTLRQQGVPVRLKQEVSSATFRVVRVGSFATVAEAEATLAALTARGVDGVVVRER
jgi:cell division protein FtsN